MMILKMSDDISSKLDSRLALDCRHHKSQAKPLNEITVLHFPQLYSLLDQALQHLDEK
jgi:hypothetical protein